MGSRFRCSRSPAKRSVWALPLLAMSRFSGTRSTTESRARTAEGGSRTPGPTTPSSTRSSAYPTAADLIRRRPHRPGAYKNSSGLRATWRLRSDALARKPVRLAHQPGQRLEHRDDHGDHRDGQADEQNAEPDPALGLVAGDATGARAVDRALAQLVAPATLERHLLLERQLDLSHALSHSHLGHLKKGPPGRPCRLARDLAAGTLAPPSASGRGLAG